MPRRRKLSIIAYRIAVFRWQPSISTGWSSRHRLYYGPAFTWCCLILPGTSFRVFALVSLSTSGNTDFRLNDPFTPSVPQLPGNHSPGADRGWA